MKKIILSLLFIGATCAVMAQQEVKKTTPANNTNNATANSNPENSAIHNSSYPSNNMATTTTQTVVVPPSVQASFKSGYPAASNVTWQQSGDWYTARYMDNGSIMQVLYREDGKVLSTMNAPVLQTYVPQDVVSKAIDKYGANLYAIGISKGPNGQDIYHVTLVGNGQSKTEWMNGDGSVAMQPFRIELNETVAGNR